MCALTREGDSTFHGKLSFCNRVKAKDVSRASKLPVFIGIEVKGSTVSAKTSAFVVMRVVCRRREAAIVLKGKYILMI